MLGFFVIIESMDKDIFYIPEETETIFQRKEGRLQVWETKDVRILQVEGEKIREELAGVIARVRKKKLGRIGDVIVWRVDGSLIRDAIDDDYTTGGHGYRYRYIPLDEIWIDDKLWKRDWPVLWHEYSEWRLMKDGMNYNDAHDQASRIEITLRRGKEFILPVRHFEQKAVYSCGAVALRIVLDFFGENWSEEILIEKSKMNSEKGTDAKDIVAAACALGYMVIWRENWTASKVIRELRRGRPFIANLQQSHELGEGHYVVIIGYTENEEFIISDPALKHGLVRRSMKEFIEHWYELEDKTQQEGIVMYKK